MENSFAVYLAPYLKSKLGFGTLGLLSLFLFWPGKKNFAPFQNLSVSTTKKILGFAIALTLILRLVWIIQSPYYFHLSRNNNLNESDLINVHAVEVMQGRGVVNPDGTPSGHRPIGYIYFLSWMYRIFGIEPWVPVFLQLILFALTLFLYFRIAAKLSIPWVACFSTLLFAVYPPSIFASIITLDEFLSIPLWFLGIDLFLTQHERFRWRTVFLLGLVWGLATIVRTESIIMPAMVAAIGILYKKNKIQWLLKSAVLGLILLSVNIPWAVRNYRAWGVPVNYAATGGFIYTALNPLATPRTGQTPKPGSPYYEKEWDEVIRDGEIQNEGKIHQTGLKLAKRWVKEHPRDFLRLTLNKFLWFFSPDNFEWALTLNFESGHFDERKNFPKKALRILTHLERLFFVPLVYGFFFLLPLFFIFRKFTPKSDRLPASETEKVTLAFLLLILSGWILLNSVYFPFAKYRLQIEPLMWLTAFYFFHRISVMTHRSVPALQEIQKTPS